MEIRFYTYYFFKMKYLKKHIINLDFENSSEIAVFYLFYANPPIIITGVLNKTIYSEASTQSICNFWGQ